MQSTDYVMNFLHEMEKDLERFEKKIDTETLKLFLRSVFCLEYSKNEFILFSIKNQDFLKEKYSQPLMGNTKFLMLSRLC
jgi:hypothetical protein